MGHAANVTGGSAWAGGSRRAQLAQRLGHHGRELLVVSILAVTALELNHPTPALALVAVLMFGVVVAELVLLRRHDRGLCEACVAVMPLDAAAQAARFRRRFWLSHTGSRPRYLAPYLAVLVGSNFLVGTTAGRVVWAMAQLSMIYLVVAQSTHRRLQPWCPWCQDGGGGERSEQPAPVLPQDDRLPA